MKRFFLICLFVNMLTSVAFAQTEAFIPLCTKPPVIDGEIDACWMNLHRYYIQKQVSNPNYQIDDDLDLSVSFKVCYNCKGDLYFLVEVNDDTLVAPNNDWRNDGLIIYLDYDNSKRPKEGWDENDIMYQMTYSEGLTHGYYSSNFSMDYYYKTGVFT